MTKMQQYIFNKMDDAFYLETLPPQVASSICKRARLEIERVKRENAELKETIISLIDRFDNLSM